MKSPSSFPLLPSTFNLRPYPAYKDSGVPWMGKIPEQWNPIRLKNVAWINRIDLPEDTAGDYTFGYIDIGSVGTGELLSKPAIIKHRNAPSRARRVVKQGDTIISTVRTYLKAVYFFSREVKDIVASTGFAVLTPHRMIVPRFLSYSLRSAPFTNRLTSESVGTAYPAIDETRLSTLEIAIPEIPDQLAIVRFLDYTDRRIRRYIRAKQKLIALLNEQKQAIIHKAVTRGLDPNVRLKPSGVEWLGDVPEHWEVKRLKAIANIRYGLGQPPREARSGLPLIRATNIDRGRILSEKLVFVDPADIPPTRNALLSEGEILVVRSGALTADSAIVPKEYEGAVAGYDMVVTVRDALPRFVAMAMLTKYIQVDQLIIASMRAAQPHLNAQELGAALILLPPMDEQVQIVEQVELKSSPIDAAVLRHEQEISLIKEYRTRLIADVVTGKLDVREVAARLPIEPEESEVMEEPEPLQNSEENSNE
jgi:type I restriction enzyme S subunit